jgi:hypothetical protein
VVYPALPGVLYHYTDVEGALGILESGELWATRTKHLNDATEIEHGRQIAISVADEILPEMDNRDPTLFIRERLADENLTDWRTTEYLGASAVASLTATRDDLLHWQSYGRSGAGVSIAFDPSELARLSSLEPMPVAPEFQLLKVRYEDDEKRQLLTEIYRYHDERMSKLFADPDYEGDSLDECYMRAITFCAALATFKGEPWRQENEWRLATTVLGSWSVRGDGLEFVRLPILDPDGGLPIIEVLLGSKVSDDDREVLEALAAKKSNHAVRLTRSSVPLK